MPDQKFTIGGPEGTPFGSWAASIDAAKRGRTPAKRRGAPASRKTAKFRPVLAPAGAGQC